MIRFTKLLIGAMTSVVLAAAAPAHAEVRSLGFTNSGWEIKKEDGVACSAVLGGRGGNGRMLLVALTMDKKVSLMGFFDPSYKLTAGEQSPYDVKIGPRKPVSMMALTNVYDNVPGVLFHFDGTGIFSVDESDVSVLRNGKELLGINFGHMHEVFERLLQCSNEVENPFGH